jgi:phage baseplate assembly protein W
VENDYLGIGISFPIEPESDEHLRMVKYEEAVRQAIRIIISTAPGERVMRPDFGCNIHDLVFGLNGSTTRGQIANEVKRALMRWEPRIDNINVTALLNPEQPNIVLIQVDYIIRLTNVRDNLVYPFYLEQA